MSKRKTSVSQLRIIGGQWRGRKLSFPDIQGLRPTQDRIRETVFNWLAPYIEGAKCLDMFAGSGAMGLEALSRGAGNTQLIELNKLAAQHIGDNLRLVTSEFGKVIQANALNHISTLSDQSVDIVFLDPPFNQGFLSKLEQNDDFYRILAPKALIYVEMERGANFTPKAASLLKEKATNTLTYRLYQLDS